MKFWQTLILTVATATTMWVVPGVPAHAAPEMTQVEQAAPAACAAGCKKTSPRDGERVSVQGLTLNWTACPGATQYVVCAYLGHPRPGRCPQPEMWTAVQGTSMPVSWASCSQISWQVQAVMPNDTRVGADGGNGSHARVTTRCEPRPFTATATDVTIKSYWTFVVRNKPHTFFFNVPEDADVGTLSMTIQVAGNDLATIQRPRILGSWTAGSKSPYGRAIPAGHKGIMIGIENDDSEAIVIAAGDILGAVLGVAEFGTLSELVFGLSEHLAESPSTYRVDGWTKGN